MISFSWSYVENLLLFIRWGTFAISQNSALFQNYSLSLNLIGNYWIVWHPGESVYYNKKTCCYSFREFGKVIEPLGIVFLFPGARVLLWFFAWNWISERIFLGWKFNTNLYFHNCNGWAYSSLLLKWLNYRIFRVVVNYG